MVLSGVPYEFRGHVNGTVADFQSLGWTELPDWIGDLTDLTQLFLYGNRLAELPDWIRNLTNLSVLSLGANEFTEIPAVIGKLTNLTTLSMHVNQLTSLPDSVGDLSNLSTLGLEDNQLTHLPDSIGNLSNLRTLGLEDNQLTRLPDGVGDLTNLTTLSLHINQLSDLPDWMGNLTNLSTLSVGANQLTHLPDWIGNLTSLSKLFLDRNRLTRLPDAIGNLSNLTQLHLDENRLEQLPGRLADILTDRLSLRLAGNPLADPLPELVSRGNAELAAYLRTLGEAVPLYEAKLLLVGEGNVGKSSLVAALEGAPFMERRPTTHGIEISPIPFRHPDLDADMILRAWDFGGQEVYRVSHQFFFSPRALYLVVWHARQGQDQNEVEGWLRRIRVRVGEGAVALVVATHSKERLPDLDYPHLQRLFPEMVAGGYEIDSSDGTGVAALRTAIGVRAAALPQMGQRISPRWMAAREAVLALAETDPQIPYERFAEICGRSDLVGEETGTLAKLMHDLGLVIYYDEDEGLKDVVVLNPEWLTKAISYVLDDRATSDAGGVLDHARLKDIWQDRDGGYPARYHPYFLRLMEKFDISYRLDGDETHSLVPQMAPHQRPALPWDAADRPPTGVRSLSLTCRMSEPASGLIPWLAARHHKASTGKYWRRGVFLRHPIDAYRSEALLSLTRDDELALEVRAPSPDLYFNVLRDSIEDLITTRWPGLTYQLFVPCPGRASDGIACPGRFRLDGLLRVREYGRTSIYPCADCGQIYEISALLTGFTHPSRPLAAQVEQIHDQLAEITASVGGLRWQTAEIAEIAETVRRVSRVVAAEVTDCPRLFTLDRRRTGLLDRMRFQQDHYLLTLWCEHPGSEHPWDPATYELDPPKEWFARVAPYVRLVLRTLQLVVPVAAAIDVAALPHPQQPGAQARLDVMEAIVADLPAGAPELTGREFADREGDAGKLSPAEGQALRAVRQIVFEHDPLHAFGDMRRVQAPAGDLLWVCPAHYPEYDPGLPTLP